MREIKWGIIGCGDVTEIKSGPAFNKVKNSSLIAVMRRDGEKAKDYAIRHRVPRWYNEAAKLINDKEVNAIYIATPPSSHETYTVAALQAGKPVYVEKPMTVNSVSALRMTQAANETNIKMCVAHYRRAQPYFKKIKQLIDDKVIGGIQFANLNFYKKLLSKEELELPGNKWRVNAGVSGGGLFHDLAPHQLDLMYYFFGPVEHTKGIAINQSGIYNTDDVVAGNILFKNDVIFNGLWCFNTGKENEKDICEIVGSEGSISFSIFGEQKILLTKNGKVEIIAFTPPQHVQQPMIEKVVEYFLDEGINPCSGEDGVEVMKLLDSFTIK
ncbi:MAG TPA: Gfo/Idh/MocA family oxidoreductase [Ginsengibacter sp.]